MARHWIAQTLTEPVHLDDWAEGVTLDKWLAPQPRPTLPSRGNIPPAAVFVAEPLDLETINVAMWHPAPPRPRHAKPPCNPPAAAFVPDPVTVAGWSPQAVRPSARLTRFIPPMPAAPPYLVGALVGAFVIRPTFAFEMKVRPTHEGAVRLIPARGR